jgi:O-antigen/teichoic acid export membrane protein
VPTAPDGAAANTLTARSATTTVLAQALARVIALGALVLSTALVARTLPVAEYADWVTVLSLVTLAGVLLDPAMTPVVVRKLVQDPGQAPRPEAMQRVRLVLGLAAFVLIVAISVVLRGADALALALALGAQTVPRALVLNAAAWLQVDHRLHRQAALEAAVAAAGLAALAVAVAAGASAPVLALVGLTLPISVLALLMRRELRLTPSAGLPSPGPQGPKVRSVVVELGPLALALVLTAL